VVTGALQRGDEHVAGEAHALVGNALGVEVLGHLVGDTASSLPPHLRANYSPRKLQAPGFVPLSGCDESSS
jgi:hypothetical protein